MADSLLQRLQRLHVPAEEPVLEDLSKYSLHQLQSMTVDFGQTHKGKSYLTMWQQHQKWVQCLLQHYGDSKKASHRRIVHYFHMEIERCELEGRSIPLTDAQPSTKNQMPVQPQNKSKAKAKMMPRVVEPRADSPDQQLVLDPETEEFSWEPVHHLMEEEETYLGNLGAEVGTLQSRMDHIENMLSQVVNHIQKTHPLTDA